MGESELVGSRNLGRRVKAKENERGDYELVCLRLLTLTD